MPRGGGLLFCRRIHPRRHRRRCRIAAHRGQCRITPPQRGCGLAERVLQVECAQFMRSRHRRGTCLSGGRDAREATVLREHATALAMERTEGGRAHQLLEVGTHEAGGSGSHRAQLLVQLRAHGQRGAERTQDVESGGGVGNRYGDLAIQTAWSTQGRIDSARAVRSTEHHEAVVLAAVHSVQQRQQESHGACTARSEIYGTVTTWTQSVHLVDEKNAATSRLPSDRVCLHKGLSQTLFRFTDVRIATVTRAQMH
mmetsp:Transcript_18045/g.54242  ORF Transcript_18045/g.54242 Transcript_18045/m.54242 type:complete len:255 (+) Transcript_18045:822-1586(+)